MYQSTFRLFIIAALCLGICHKAGRADEISADSEKTDVLVVVGAGGEESYANMFAEWEERWRQACSQACVSYQSIGVAPSPLTSDAELVQDALKAITAEGGPFWLVFIGHGTSNQGKAKFNLNGPDISAQEVSKWLFHINRPLIVINTTSSSGPFLKALSTKDRVVITATKSGAEQNFARFGEYLSRAWTATSADLDHDDQTSVLEAFLYASNETQRYYQEKSLLATEHAMLDDNGDALGTSADAYTGIQRSKDSGDIQLDGSIAHRYHLIPNPDAVELSPEQAAMRDRIESEIESLRDRKSSMREDEYYKQLEQLLVPFARLYSDES